jgi:hypothetical protein
LTICARDRCFTHGVAIRTMSSTDEANLSCSDGDCPFGPYPLWPSLGPLLPRRRLTIRVVLAAHPILMRKRLPARRDVLTALRRLDPAPRDRQVVRALLRRLPNSRAVSAVNAPFSRRRSCLRPSTFASESTSSVCARLTANVSPSFAATRRDWRSVSAADFASRKAASECVASSCAPALIEFATPGSAATSPVSMLACCDAETPASS